jgi:hypothetical protein
MFQRSNMSPSLPANCVTFLRQRKQPLSLVRNEAPEVRRKRGKSGFE